ncbi:hypothetical protein CGH72_08345 [Vibrio parahaemolyticus]|nr:hypothetical protein CGI25_22185 [Vibrio parahaemolyticus]TOM57308.1 hypothetical protein CGH75_14470 [Vibrio parahaemolyticus]TOM64921.1 hypothetical protein CGH73_20775 [Vibrio parahaemolyticus]TOM73618.1 hypothetical protein CGH72_08345 [Vibrio parahaemolyticus]TOO83887.1 hypothetical protein CGH29_18580 [Vibrio parahaemolyticus]
MLVIILVITENIFMLRPSHIICLGAKQENKGKYLSQNQKATPQEVVLVFYQEKIFQGINYDNF